MLCFVVVQDMEKDVGGACENNGGQMLRVNTPIHANKTRKQAWKIYGEYVTFRRDGTAQHKKRSAMGMI